jgi:DNA-binding SARP family transcriptional activator/TolB-like protein
VNIRPGTNTIVSGVETGSPASPRLSLHLLGVFELARGGQKVAVPGKRERALLAYLALSPKGRQPRRKLAALLWGDATDETLLDNLRTCVWRLRKAMGDAGHRLLASDEDDIVLDLAAFDVDLLTLRSLCRQAGRAELDAAARLCSGEFLSGLDLDSEEFESWRRIEASLYQDQAVDALTRLTALLVRQGESERAIETGTRLLGLDPLNEKAARHVMQLYAASGRRGAAIQLYQSLAEALKKSLNTQPEAETRRLFASLNQAGAECADSESANPAVAKVDDKTTANVFAPYPVAMAKAQPPVRRWLLPLGVLVLTMAALAATWRIASPSAGPPAAPVRAAAATKGKIAGLPATPLIIAVLPFDNQTGNAGLQSFSDGLAEEISASLKQMPGLTLVAPGSAIQVTRAADKRDVDIASDVRFLIEGDVRAAQNHVTVTAKLIRTDSGASVWSQSYDRELNDISTVRTVTAMAIADAVKTPLGLAQAKQPPAAVAIDANSYAQFLRAQALMRTRFTGAPEAMDILAQLVKRNPNFAPAWAALGQCYAWMPSFLSPYEAQERHRRVELFFPMAREAAHRAIALDPGLAQPYVALAHIEAFNGRWAASLDFLTKALARDPSSVNVLDNQMSTYAILGFRKKALAVSERLLALDPDGVTTRQDVAEVRWENGQADGPIATLKALIDRPSGPTSLSMMYASVGRYADAAGVLETALKGPGTLPQTWPESFRIAAGYLRQAPSKIALPADPPHLDRVGFAYLYIGAPEHAFDNYQDWIKSGQRGGQGNSFSYVWNDAYAPARKTKQFKQFARDAGFVAYWRERGWPDLCRPVGAGDFVCR